MNVRLKRIVVFRIGHLGDTLVALPAFWAIRRAFPEAHITLLSNADPNNPHYVSAKSVVPAEGLFDSWLSYPSSTSKLRYGIDFLRLAARLRKRRYDAAFYLMPRIRSEYQIKRDLAFFGLAGIKHVFGADHLRANLLPFKASAPLSLIESESEYLLECVKAEGIVPSHDVWDDLLLLNKTERFTASTFLQKNIPEAFSDFPLVAVAPGSKWESKIWSENKYGEVVARLINERNTFPVIFGGPEDRAIGDRLIKLWGRGANAAGVLGIREAAAALERCEVYLGNDTGTMHLAASVGTPCVAIFAAVDHPGRWYPAGESHHIFRKAVECEGCHTPNCFNNHLCLELIDPELVYSACVQVLSERRDTPSDGSEVELAAI